jgi:RNA polymerase sigma factor (sigma-70 family)
MIFRYGGDYDTANEIFQESIITLYRRAKAGEVKESLIVEKYLFRVCRWVWFRLYNNNLESTIDSDFEDIDDSEDNIINEFLQSRRKKLFSEHFEKLDIECKRILMAFFKGKSYEYIGNKYKLGSEEKARRKKYLCKEFLVKSIKNDPQYRKLIGEYDEDLFQTD